MESIAQQQDAAAAAAAGGTEEEHYGSAIKREQKRKRKLRVLCLHGFRTSGSILQQQLQKWDRTILDLLDLTFLDGPFSCRGKSDVEGIFPPPYYEWFQYNIIFTEFTGLEHCFGYISDFMEEHGPFDALLGFSQGAVLSAALAGLQQKGVALRRHPPLRFVVVISGAMFKHKDLLSDCYSQAIKCPSVHLVGANDWLKPKNEELLRVFEQPLLLRHEAKHTVPRLDDQLTRTMRGFLNAVLLQGAHEDQSPATSPTSHPRHPQIEVVV